MVRAGSYPALSLSVPQGANRPEHGDGTRGALVCPALAFPKSGHMSVATVIAIVSLAIAAVSFVVNYWVSHRAAIRARKPVLVFVDDPRSGCWVLQNVGNGPALNVLVAQREFGYWFNPVLTPPLAKDSGFSLEWLGRVNTTGLGATYSDFEDRRYTSTLGGERSRTYERNRLPDWNDREVRRYWELRGEEAKASRWSQRPSGFSA
jgi:hypothetical protein